MSAFTTGEITFAKFSLYAKSVYECRPFKSYVHLFNEIKINQNMQKIEMVKLFLNFFEIKK